MAASVSCGLHAALAVAVVMACGHASGAALYGCQDARGHVAYSTVPCAPGAVALPIDSAGSAARVLPREQPSEAAPFTPGSPGHQLTPEEQERVARLRTESRNAPAELQVANEIEIAAIREGADVRVSERDRAMLLSLRSELAAADPRVRADALARWRTIYGRYRMAARPRSSVAGAIRPDGSLPTVPELPLGTAARGTHGPLVPSPAEPSSALPLQQPPVADPATGRVLAPAGNDRLIDPLTGTMWMRSGRVYVDPASGRLIPAP